MKGVRPHWEALKREVWTRCGGRCEGCGCELTRGAAHLHHLTYERKGAELASDVRYLCLQCHGLKHPHHTFLSVTAQRAIAAARRKVPTRKGRPSPPPAERDPAYEHVQAMLAARKAQRTTSGRFGR